MDYPQRENRGAQQRDIHHTSKLNQQPEDFSWIFLDGLFGFAERVQMTVHAGSSVGTTTSSGTYRVMDGRPSDTDLDGYPRRTVDSAQRRLISRGTCGRRSRRANIVYRQGRAADVHLGYLHGRDQQARDNVMAAPTGFDVPSWISHSGCPLGPRSARSILLTSHTVAVDQSGSMRNTDVDGGATRSDAVWLTLALTWVDAEIKAGNRTARTSCRREHEEQQRGGGGR